MVEFEKGTARVKYAAEVKLTAVDRFKILEAWQEVLDVYREPRMLVVPYLTAEMAERCRLLKIPFLDAAGNAYLELGRPEHDEARPRTCCRRGCSPSWPGRERS